MPASWTIYGLRGIWSLNDASQIPVHPRVGGVSPTLWVFLMQRTRPLRKIRHVTSTEAAILVWLAVGAGIAGGVFLIARSAVQIGSVAYRVMEKQISRQAATRQAALLSLAMGAALIVTALIAGYAIFAIFGQLSTRRDRSTPLTTGPSKRRAPTKAGALPLSRDSVVAGTKPEAASRRHPCRVCRSALRCSGSRRSSALLANVRPDRIHLDAWANPSAALELLGAALATLAVNLAAAAFLADVALAALLSARVARPRLLEAAHVALTRLYLLLLASSHGSDEMSPPCQAHRRSSLFPPCRPIDRVTGSAQRLKINRGRVASARTLF